MSRGWQAKTLVEVATLQRGFDLPTHSRVSGRFPLISSSGISDTHHKHAVKGPGVVTGRSGSIGKVFFIEDDFWPLNTVLYVKDFHGNDPRFVYYLLKKFDLRRFASGTGVPTLNRNFVHDEIVKVPSISEQRRIVTILDQAFEDIAKAIANAEQSLENADKLIGSYFDASLNGRDNWIVLPVHKCFKVRSGDFLPAKQMDESGFIPVYGGNGIAGHHVAGNLDGDNIIIGRVGAKCGNVRNVKGRLWLTDNALYVSELLQPFDREFLAIRLKSEDLRRTANQTAQPVISYSTIKDINLSFPVKVHEQRQVVESLNALRAAIDSLQSTIQVKISALEELKQSLLHQAFSGNL